MLLGRLKIVIGDPPKQTHGFIHIQSYKQWREKASKLGFECGSQISNYSLPWLDMQKHQRRFMKLRSQIFVGKVERQACWSHFLIGVTQPACQGSACRTLGRSGWWRGCCQPFRALSCCRSTSQLARPLGSTSRVCPLQMSPEAWSWVSNY